VEVEAVRQRRPHRRMLNDRCRNFDVPLSINARNTSLSAEPTVAAACRFFSSMKDSCSTPSRFGLTASKSSTTGPDRKATLAHSSSHHHTSSTSSKEQFQILTPVVCAETDEKPKACQKLRWSPSSSIGCRNG
jgi:hypothetical protein